MVYSTFFAEHNTILAISLYFSFADTLKSVHPSNAHTMSKANLVQLPLELRDAIALQCDLSSLAALLCTCKGLRTPFAWYLYQAIDCQYDRRPHLASLAVSLLANADNAALVTHIDFVKSFTTGDYKVWNPSIDQVGKADADILGRARTILDFLPEGDVERLLATNYPPLLAGLIIPRLKNLETLKIGHGSLGHWSDVNDVTLGRCLRESTSSQKSRYLEQPFLGRLTEVKLGSKTSAAEIFRESQYTGSVAGHINVGDAMVWALSLPGLQRLETTLSYNEDLCWAGAVHHPSNLKTLSLLHTEAPTKVLKKLLALTPHLETFHYEYCHDIEKLQARVRYHRLQLEPLTAALMEVRSSLRKLVIKVAWYYSAKRGWHEFTENDSHFGFDDHLGSLKEFRVLSDIEVPMPLMWGIEVHGREQELRWSLQDFLPASVQRLTLREDGTLWDGMWYGGDYASHTLRLAAELKGCQRWCPHLRQVMMRTYWDDPVERELVETCASEGITWIEWLVWENDVEGS